MLFVIFLEFIYKRISNNSNVLQLVKYQSLARIQSFSIDFCEPWFVVQRSPRRKNVEYNLSVDSRCHSARQSKLYYHGQKKNIFRKIQIECVNLTPVHAKLDEKFGATFEFHPAVATPIVPLRMFFELF